ncbi:MAG: hypothetical protein IKE22_05745, partial [Atopobiaceae bacterium]|nr:hypothetical protein [Atopobiaceae bacterium]
MIEKLHEEFKAQDIDLDRAMREMTRAIRDINEVIEINDGGSRGIHGNIAEVAEAGVRNARRLIEGKSKTYERLYDFSEDDLRRGKTYLQMKFSESGGSFSLDAVRKHLAKYPDYVNRGKKYVIPHDHYETVKRLYEMSERDASRLARSGGGPSYRQWRQVQAFFAETGISINDIEPSAFDYSEVQKGNIRHTIGAEKAGLKQTHDVRRDRTRSDALAMGSASIQEGIKAAGSAAAIESATEFIVAIASKLKDGKHLRDLDENDWIEIAGESERGFAKGAVRGASVYFITSLNVAGYVSQAYSLATHDYVAKAIDNYISTSGVAASALVTASFGVAEQAHRMRTGAIDETEFLERSELLCLDASVSAFSSIVGQAVIPIPVLGAVIGNTVGNVLYQIAKDGLNEKEQALAEAYIKEQQELDAALDARYQMLVAELNQGMKEYLALLDRALSPDSSEAFDGSIALARSLGVPEDEL